jgi:hypothetical protein
LVTSAPGGLARYAEGRLFLKTAPETALVGEGLLYLNDKRWNPPGDQFPRPFDPKKTQKRKVSIDGTTGQVMLTYKTNPVSISNPECLPGLLFGPVVGQFAVTSIYHVVTLVDRFAPAGPD